MVCAFSRVLEGRGSQPCGWFPVALTGMRYSQTQVEARRVGLGKRPPSLDS
jgi:hypothetical protein